jgi:hypothetical protein
MVHAKKEGRGGNRSALRKRSKRSANFSNSFRFILKNTMNFMNFMNFSI